MPRFEPFAGLRYHADIDLDAVTAPPYDVIDEQERAALAARTGYNAVRVDLPVDGEGEPGEDRYATAARFLAEFVADGVLVHDDAPSLYVYRMGHRDETGAPRQTTGVIGALGIELPGEGDVLPHEQTTPKAASDRLELLRATAANLSPIWGLSLGEGLSALCETIAGAPPDGRCTDPEGVHHRIWRVTSPALVEQLTAVVAGSPVVIADGHHRYETSRQYRDERRAVEGAGPWDLTMALVVELTEDELAVRPIHRLLHGLAGADPVAALGSHFDVTDGGTADATLPARMVDAGALALVLADGGVRLLRPRSDAFPQDLPDLDSSRLQHALASALPDVTVRFQHGVDRSLAAVAGRSADAAVLLRPATVAQITETAHRRERMPPKTTYFHPKPRTGMVFRPLS
jgi:uncharacterized protein (DUF1015 family)